MKNTKNILIEKLHAFENHPYKVQDNEEMERLSESIREHGVLSPIIVVLHFIRVILKCV